MRAISGAARVGPAADATGARRRMQPRVVGTALLAAIALVALGTAAAGPRQGLLAAIGLVAGVSLYHASFGFTSAWRNMLTQRRSLGLRAQLVMIALASTAFFPLLARGEAFGQSLTGFVNPVGAALCLGAFLFGIGMQLGGGCGSGTLFTAGGGNARMAATLLAFVAGSVLATSDPLGWTRWPAHGGISVVEAFGAPTALAGVLSVLVAVHLALVRSESARHGDVQPLLAGKKGDLLRGPWPIVAGALALALVNIATLIVAGRPWGITSAFALWGAKIAALAGADVAHWSYWAGDASLQASVFADATSVMDFGIMTGAFAAAGLAGAFAPQARIPLRSLAAAVAGGLLMGFGARLATGCNIGAFFSGLVSGSLHGLVWLAFALPGNAVGVRLRPLFGMSA